MEHWYTQKGAYGETALVSYVSLSRNFRGLPYPVRLNATQKSAAAARVTQLLQAAGRQFTAARMSALYPYEAVALADRLLIPPAFASAPEGSALITDETKELCLMLCDEDHVCIRALTPALSPEAAFDAASEIDVLLDRAVGWAFSQKLGYLNQDPANLGTGMRAGVLLHLPALSRTGAAPGLVSMAARLGFRMHGAYGDGFSVPGDLFTVENTVVMGISETQALSNLKSFCLQLSTRERAAAEALVGGDITVQDRLRRSWALLTSAALLTTEETMQMISDVRLAALTGSRNVPVEKLNTLFVAVQPATVNCAAGARLPRHERDVLRAQLVKKILGVPTE